MVHIEFFDDVESMMKALTESMEAADARVQVWQKAIKKGDYFWQDTEYGFRIYGEVLQNAYKEKRLRNYRFCKCYSEACPEGEFGDVHVCVVGGPLTKEEFEEARENGWQ